MPIRFVHSQQMYDTLHNLSQSVAHTENQIDYGRGVLVGVVACLITQGLTFEKAVTKIRPYLPELLAQGTVPESWEAAVFNE